MYWMKAVNRFNLESDPVRRITVHIVNPSEVSSWERNLILRALEGFEPDCPFIIFDDYVILKPHDQSTPHWKELYYLLKTLDRDASLRR